MSDNKFNKMDVKGFCWHWRWRSFEY